MKFFVYVISCWVGFLVGFGIRSRFLWGLRWKVFVGLGLAVESCFVLGFLVVWLKGFYGFERLFGFGGF